MAKDVSESKKLIPIYLQDLFLQKTDCSHYVRMPEILSFLETKGIFADRRTIYLAISVLNQSGFEIIGVQEKGGYKYHHPSRLFDNNELKFLIDSVAASKFLTEKKSKELITKVQSLASVYERESLNRYVLLGKRIKSMNDKVLKNLDIIYLALSANSQITFQYMRWNPQKKLEFLRSGKPLCVSPFAVSLNDDNYYLVAYENRTDTLKHYRIDKMASIKLTAEEREGMSLYKSFNIGDYTRKTFSMFGGEEQTVSIECPNNLVGVFIDRFGDSISIRPSFDKKDFSIVRVSVNVSLQFYAWIFGLGKDTKILSPQTVVENFKQTTIDILSNY